MRVLVCGGREYHEHNRLVSVLDDLDKIYNFTQVISGDAKGVDLMALAWAKSRGIPCMMFKADWERWGNAAGPMRNREMVEAKPELVIAFPGYRGTADMTRQAEKANIKVLRVS